jgi:hypothetical protein
MMKECALCKSLTKGKASQDLGWWQTLRNSEGNIKSPIIASFHEETTFLSADQSRDRCVLISEEASPGGERQGQSPGIVALAIDNGGPFVGTQIVCVSGRIRKGPNGEHRGTPAVHLAAGEGCRVGLGIRIRAQNRRNANCIEGFLCHL